MFPRLIYSITGNPQFFGQWTDLTTVQTIPSILLEPPKEATHYVYYTSGDVAAILVNETLTGGTSAKTAIMVAKATFGGTVGGHNAFGILLLRAPSGTFVAETLTGGTSSGTVVIANALIPLKFKGIKARAFLGIVSTAAVNWTIDGTLPTVSGGTNVGMPTGSGVAINIGEPDALQQFQVINGTASNSATLQWTLFF